MCVIINMCSNVCTNILSSNVVVLNSWILSTEPPPCLCHILIPHDIVLSIFSDIKWSCQQFLCQDDTGIEKKCIYHWNLDLRWTDVLIVSSVRKFINIGFDQEIRFKIWLSISVISMKHWRHVHVDIAGTCLMFRYSLWLFQNIEQRQQANMVCLYSVSRVRYAVILYGRHGRNTNDQCLVSPSLHATVGDYCRVSEAETLQAQNKAIHALPPLAATWTTLPDYFWEGVSVPRHAWSRFSI